MKCLELLARLSLSFFISLFLYSYSFAVVEIKLKKIANVETQQIKLQDIAHIKSNNQNFANYISSLVVKKLSSDKTKITKKEVLNILKNNYVSLKDVVVKGDYTIIILKKTTVNKDFLERRLKDFIKKHYQNIEVEKINLPNITVEVIGKPKIKIVPKGNTRSYMYFDIFVDNYKTSASVKYFKTTKAVVARRYIPKGSIIQPTDVAVNKVKAKNDERYFTDVNEIIGKKVRFAIRKGQPITLKSLEKEYFVLRNTNVEVLYEKNGFRIKLLGRALENGEMGDLIKVRNTSSGKVILCRVIGKNKVKFISGRD